MANIKVSGRVQKKLLFYTCIAIYKNVFLLKDCHSWNIQFNAVFTQRYTQLEVSDDIIIQVVVIYISLITVITSHEKLNRYRYKPTDYIYLSIKTRSLLTQNIEGLFFNLTTFGKIYSIQHFPKSWVLTFEIRNENWNIFLAFHLFIFHTFVSKIFLQIFAIFSYCK